MKIFIAFAGPRLKGSTAVLMNCFIDGIKSVRPDAEFVDGQIYKKKIKYCLGCSACKTTADRCVQHDDMYDMYDEIYGCDVIILASPIFWFNISGQLKTFIDRLYGLPSGGMSNKTLVYITTFQDVDEYASGAHNAVNSLKEVSEYIGIPFESVFASTGEMIVSENEEAKKYAFDRGAAFARGYKK